LVNSIRKRRRGTAIVDTPRGVLLDAGRHGAFLLPGGGANRHETRTDAAARELSEETHLKTRSSKFLFHHSGRIHEKYRYRDNHTVCLIKATGKPRPHHEVRRIAFYNPGCRLKISRDTRAILDRYYCWKQQRAYLKKEQSEGKIFLTSDLHLDHSNIIRYCHRPLSTKHDMNKTLISNWNITVKDNDTVFFLGDLAPFQSKPRLYGWLNRLKGTIIRIQGSHDPPNFGLDYKILECNGHKFFLLHDPDRSPHYGKCLVPPGWQGWAIHGHTHNNQTARYPFINGETKTINVSVELTDYKPVSIEFIESLRLDRIKRMETIQARPELW
jgi:calcineurin-like phosphoesterase family protein/ADP-ribose pyrophosphatase YjhB (NUDIX family)